MGFQVNHLSPGLHVVTASLVCGTGMTGSGAVAYGKGIDNIDKADPGDLDVTLTEKPSRVLCAFATVRMATPGLTKMVPGAVTGKVIRFTNLDAAGSPADVASGDIIDFFIAYDRDGLNDRNGITLSTT